MDYVSGLSGVRKVTHSADTIRALQQIKSASSRLIAGSAAVLVVISVLLLSLIHI